MDTDHLRFADGLSALDAGDVTTLRALLADAPSLASARSTSSEAPYEGYFHGATLLHHVAGNPIRGTMPANIVEVATVLLEAGSDTEAGCGGGPAQPGTGGGTVMGLVTSGSQAHIHGHTEGLIDLLLAYGAKLDPEGGMFGSLYHTVEHQGQRDVARMLYERGVRADLPIAAGLGRLDLVRSFIGPDGLPTPHADTIWRRTARGGAPATQAEVMADALLTASVNGWPDVVVWLLDSGAPIDTFRPWGGFSVTPLHGAAWAGWADVVSLLLGRGADPTLREATYDGTPRDWAAHCNRPEALSAFDRAP